MVVASSTASLFFILIHPANSLVLIVFWLFGTAIYLGGVTAEKKTGLFRHLSSPRSLGIRRRSSPVVFGA